MPRPSSYTEEIADRLLSHEVAPRHPGGRPSLYDPAYCDEIVDFCGQGYSVTAYAGKIGVSRECLTKWGQAHSEFLLAIKRAKAAASLWWEDRGRASEGAPALTIFNLKNLAPDDFKDKLEIEGATQQHTTINVALLSADERANLRALAEKVLAGSAPKVIEHEPTR